MIKFWKLFRALRAFLDEVARIFDSDELKK